MVNLNSFTYIKEENHENMPKNNFKNYYFDCVSRYRSRFQSNGGAQTNHREKREK